MQAIREKSIVNKFGMGEPMEQRDSLIIFDPEEAQQADD